MLNESKVGWVAAGSAVEVKFWGIAPSFAFVAERFNRTLKEQAIHGRILTELPDAPD